MESRVHSIPAAAARSPEGRPIPVVRVLTWPQGVPLAAGAVAAFHLAWIYPPLSFLVLLYLYCLQQLASLPTARQAFYFGLAIGYAAYAPHLTFFWTIFGWPAVVLWGVLAFWVGLFVALARLCRRRFGRPAVALIPFLWTGLEYFRSELYPLRFSWLDAGYAFFDAPRLLNPLGVYGLGLVLMLAASAVSLLPKKPGAAALGGLLVLLGCLAHLSPGAESVPGSNTMRVAGAQLEFPLESDVLAVLDRLAANHPDAELLVLSEYTLQRPPSEEIRAWCRNTRHYLAVGGKDFISDSTFYNTVFVVDPRGEIVFRQAKSVPVQFFADGLPAPEQRVWRSPWGAIGFCICYDLSYRRVVDRLIRLGAEAIIVPTADEVRWGEREHWLHARVAAVRSAELGVPIFRVASSGISQSVDARGRTRATAPFPGQGETIGARLDLAGPGHLPIDAWLAPLAAAATAALILGMSFQALRARGRRSADTFGTPGSSGL